MFVLQEVFEWDSTFIFIRKTINISTSLENVKKKYFSAAIHNEDSGKIYKKQLFIIQLYSCFCI